MYWEIMGESTHASLSRIECNKRQACCEMCATRTLLIKLVAAPRSQNMGKEVNFTLTHS